MRLEGAKDRLLQQFIDSRPLGMTIKEDLEDIEQELTLMELEGIDLTKITIRCILKRLGVFEGGYR